MNRLLVVVALLFGWLILPVIITVVGRVVDDRRARRTQYTVIWRDTGLMLCAFTGVITPLDETHILVVDGDGWPVIIDRRDIVGVH